MAKELRGRKKKNISGDEIITMNNVSKAYATGAPALNGVDLHIKKGEFVFIVGDSGSGKSTLLKILAGQEETDEGGVILGNHVVVRYLPQNPVFSPEARVRLQIRRYPLPDAVILAVIIRFRCMYVLFHYGRLLFPPVYAKADVGVPVAPATSIFPIVGIK